MSARLFFLVMGIFNAGWSSAYAASEVVCDIRIDSDFGDEEIARVPGGFTVDSATRTIHLAAFPEPTWLPTFPTVYTLTRGRGETKDSYAVQGFESGEHFPNPSLIEVIFLRGDPTLAVVRVGDVFHVGNPSGAAEQWQRFGKYAQFTVDRCQGLDILAELFP